MVEFGQKIVVFGQSGGISSKGGCIRGKVFIFGQNGCIRVGQSCCIRAKVVVVGQKWLYSGKVVVLG